jgi:hypothetical protein
MRPSDRRVPRGHDCLMTTMSLHTMSVLSWHRKLSFRESAMPYEGEYLTPAQVAKILQVSTTSVHRMFYGVSGVVDLGVPERFSKRRKRLLRIPQDVLKRFSAERSGKFRLPPPRPAYSRKYDPSQLGFPQKAHRKYSPCREHPSGTHYRHPNGVCRSCGSKRDEVRLSSAGAEVSIPVQTDDDQANA